MTTPTRSRERKFLFVEPLRTCVPVRGNGWRMRLPNLPDCTKGVCVCVAWRAGSPASVRLPWSCCTAQALQPHSMTGGTVYCGGTVHTRPQHLRTSTISTACAHSGNVHVDNTMKRCITSIMHHGGPCMGPHRHTRARSGRAGRARYRAVLVLAHMLRVMARARRMCPQYSASPRSFVHGINGHTRFAHDPCICGSNRMATRAVAMRATPQAGP